MNKTELVHSVAREANLTQDEALRILNAFIKTITKSLKDGNSVVIAGFGSFNVKQREARDGRNPKTGEIIKIKPSKLASFKAGKSLKDSINS